MNTFFFTESTPSLIELTTTIFLTPPPFQGIIISQNQQRAQQACWLCWFSIPLLTCGVDVEILTKTAIYLATVDGLLLL